MARDGNGDFALLTEFAPPGQTNNPTSINANMDDIAEALSDSINKNGTKAFEADQSHGNFKITDLGGGEDRQDGANLGQVQDSNVAWAAASGTADAIEATFVPPIIAPRQGMVLRVRALLANATIAPTFSPNGLTARAITKHGGQALAAGDIVGAGHVIILSYDFTNTRWELLNARNAPTGLSAGTTTEALTGSDTSKYLTADANAALWEKGANTASAGTVSIAEGGYLHITGTTTITDIDFATAKDGRAITVQFDGILTLTHNATTLVLPGGANITTAAGDTACFVQDNADNIKCLWYTRAAQPLIASTGSAPLYGVRAWVVFDGSGTPAITASGNVTSITDNGVGDYTINLTTALPNANYAVSGTAYHATRNAVVTVDSGTAPTTTAVRIQVGAIDLNAGTASADAYDSTRISVILVG